LNKHAVFKNEKGCPWQPFFMKGFEWEYWGSAQSIPKKNT